MKKKTVPFFVNLSFELLAHSYLKNDIFSESPLANLFRYFIPREVAIFPFQFKSLSFKGKKDFCVDRK